MKIKTPFSYMEESEIIKVLYNSRLNFKNRNLD